MEIGKNIAYIPFTNRYLAMYLPLWYSLYQQGR